MTTQIVIESVNLIGATAELKFAIAFVDQKRRRKPIVLVITHQKLPVEKLESEGFLLLPSSSLARRLVTPKFKHRRKPRAKAANFPRRRISRCAQNRFALREFAARVTSNAPLAKIFRSLDATHSSFPTVVRSATMKEAGRIR